MTSNLTPFDQWLASAPTQIQELAKKFPPGKYRLASVVPDEAPYTYVVPHSRLQLEGYGLDGTLLVRVRPEDKTLARLLFERGTSDANQTIDPEHYNSFTFNIDSRYVLPYRRK